MSKRDKQLVESLARRIKQSIANARLSRLVSGITRFSLTASIKLNGYEISPVFTFIILMLGILFSLKLVIKGVIQPIIYPIVKHFFFKIMKRRSKLFARVSNLQQMIKAQKSTNKLKWVLVYGATSHIGVQISKLFASHGYCLILVDANLTKLQAIKEEALQVFPHLDTDLIKLVNLNFSQNADVQ